MDFDKMTWLVVVVWVFGALASLASIAFVMWVVVALLRHFGVI